MTWLRVQIELGGLAPEPVEAALLRQGALAVEYHDAGDQPIFEPPPGTTPLWQKLTVAALLAPDTGPEQVRLAVAAAVAPEPLPRMQFDSVPDRDWVRAFQETLAPQRFGQSLWLVPPGSAPPADAQAVVRLEPGLAFGSGSHPTTALCLEWLDATTCKGAVLDYGCGSGVLALAALALGATRAVAVDIDPQARAACLENARRNDAADQLEVLAPEALAAERRFDALVANILSGPLMELAPVLSGHLQPGAAIALSGILSDQAKAVRERFEPWVRFGAPAHRGDWVLLAGHARGTI